MTEKLKVGIIGATGMVGQKFVALLANHPWFEVTQVAASPRSAGKKYSAAVKGRWNRSGPIPSSVKNLTVKEVEKDLPAITKNTKLIFSALSLDKNRVKEIENRFAAEGIAVISNNSAHRWTKDVPMILPEVNYRHLELIKSQRKNRGWSTGLIVVKPNCSIQSYVPALEALSVYHPQELIVTTFQSISGAGKTFETWPEMQGNVIPQIRGEEQKSELEPLRVWGKLTRGEIKLASKPEISANCVRVATTDGHMALVNVAFKTKPTKAQMISAWESYISPLAKMNLPSAPKPFLKYLPQADRPQTALDRDFQNGMGITIGRLRKDTVLDWKFACLSHNTVRGAAGGAVLTAELLKHQGYIN